MGSFEVPGNSSHIIGNLDAKSIPKGSSVIYNAGNSLAEVRSGCLDAVLVHVLQPSHEHGVARGGLRELRRGELLHGVPDPGESARGGARTGSRLWQTQEVGKTCQRSGSRAFVTLPDCL